jgi:hypothetical protein
LLQRRGLFLIYTKSGRGEILDFGWGKGLDSGLFQFGHLLGRIEAYIHIVE